MAKDRMQGTIDGEVLERKMMLKGMSSISELVQAAGVHRNSIMPYLNGERSVYSSVFERICDALDSNPSELVTYDRLLDCHGLFPILRKLWSEKSYSKLCCFLFGSRASGKEKKFSDYDIGVSGGVSPIDSIGFLELKESILTQVDDLAVSVDIVDFDNAPEWFLFGINHEPKLVCGNEIAFQQLLGRMYEIRKTKSAS